MSHMATFASDSNSSVSQAVCGQVLMGMTDMSGTPMLEAGLLL